MSAPNPAQVMRNRQQRLAEEAAPRWYTSERRYTGHMVGIVAAATDGREPADLETYSQPQTGAVLTVGEQLATLEWHHEGPEGTHEAFLVYYALVEKPRRHLVFCCTCREAWDEKR